MERLPAPQEPVGIGPAAGGLPHAVRAAAFEIGQPLRLIDALVRRLAPHVAGVDGQALLELLTLETHRAQALTTRLETTGHPEAGPPPRAATELGDIVREVVAVERHRIVGPTDTLELALADGTHRIWADRLQVGQALRHLLSCAMGGDAAADTPRHIRIATVVRRTAVLLHVADLSPVRHMPRFTAWSFPVAVPTDRTLELAIVRRIVREHGAEFTVASHPGQATCYTIAWPCPTELR